MSDNQEVEMLLARNKELREALSGMLEWLDSEPVKKSLHQAANLTRTHPHLGIKIEPEFAEWAGKVIARARAAVK